MDLPKTYILFQKSYSEGHQDADAICAEKYFHIATQITTKQARIAALTHVWSNSFVFCQ